MNTDRLRWVAFSAVVLGSIAALSTVSYLVFHSMVEIAIMVVGFGIFTLTWNLRHTMDNGYFLLVGLAALFVGSMDLLHTLSFKGMNLLPGFDANLPTQLWIASRYMTSLTLLVAPFLMGRKLSGGRLVLIYAAITAVLLGLIFTGYFPDCFVEGVGLTPFKRASEFIVAGILTAALVLLLRQHKKFDASVLRMQAWSIVLSIAAGLPFVLYTAVNDRWNMVGHLFRLSAVIPLYRAIVETGLRQPISLLYHNLKQSEEGLRAERNFVSAALDMAGAPLIVLDDDGRIVRMNHVALDLAGDAAADAAGKVLWELVIPPAEAAAAASHFRMPLDTGEAHSFESYFVAAGGELRTIWWTARPMAHDGSSTRYIICTGVDITERRQMEQQLLSREDRLRALVDSVPTGMLLIDPESRRIVDANPAAARLIGLPAQQIVGQGCKAFMDCDADYENCLCRRPEVAQPTDTALRSADGRSVPIHRTVAPVVTGGRNHLLVSFVDMTEHKQMEEQLRSLALVDELTGLHNRRGFLALAPKEIALSLKLRRGMFLMFIDLDELQRINESRGHQVGNQALRGLGQVLQTAFGATGLVARVGGDEFVVLLPQYAGLDSSLLTARLKHQLELYNTMSPAAQLSVSVGVATLNPDQPCSIYELLDRADNDMYLERRRQLLHSLSGVRPLPSK